MKKLLFYCFHEDFKSCIYDWFYSENIDKQTEYAISKKSLVFKAFLSI